MALTRCGVLTLGTEVMVGKSTFVLGYAWKMLAATCQSVGLQHWHYQFEATTCPPWDLEGKHTEKKGGLFPHPPRASDFKSHVRLRRVLSL